MQLRRSASDNSGEETNEISRIDKKTRLKNHRLALTCLCIDSQNQHAFTGSKDGSIIKWSIEDRKILGKINSINRTEYESSEKVKDKHHFKHINCVTISSDDKLLATGGWDKCIRIWSPENLDWIHTFTLHKGEVTALSFRHGHSTLYSGSSDRSIMLWTLEDDDNRCFVEALYGHESTVTSLDALRKERILSSGSRDQSVRIWKIVEQAQTIYECKHESVDVAKYVDDKIFVTGGEDGNISVWTTMKRSPLYTLKGAHKPTKKVENNSCHFDRGGLSYWISALATFYLKEPKKARGSIKRQKLENDDTLVLGHNEDLDASESEPEDQDLEDEKNDQVIAFVASGSCDSELKIWKLSKSEGKYEMTLHRSFDCPGFVNDLRFTSDGNKILAACGQEHKFGRWWKLKSSKNCMRIFETDQ